jgi:hypothetical protein
MDKLFEILGPAGILIALAMAAGVIVFIFLWIAKNKPKIKGKNGEVFQLGDATPFEKTNQRFKQLCIDIKDLKTEVTGLKGQFDSTHNDIKVISGALRKVQMDQQKQLFYDSDQRAGERMYAGLRYVAMGGNGEVKQDVAEFVRGKNDAYNAITAAMPDLRLPLVLLKEKEEE